MLDLSCNKKIVFKKKINKKYKFFKENYKYLVGASHGDNATATARFTRRGEA